MPRVKDVPITYVFIDSDDFVLASLVLVWYSNSIFVNDLDIEMAAVSTAAFQAEDKQHILLAPQILTFLSTSIAVPVRILSWELTGVPFGWDDYFIVIAYVRRDILYPRRLELVFVNRQTKKHYLLCQPDWRIYELNILNVSHQVIHSIRF